MGRKTFDRAPDEPAVEQLDIEKILFIADQKDADDMLGKHSEMAGATGAAIALAESQLPLAVVVLPVTESKCTCARCIAGKLHASAPPDPDMPGAKPMLAKPASCQCTRCLAGLSHS